VLAMPAEGTGARVRTAPEREQWPPQRRRFHLHTSPVAPEQVTA
jgi:hypothetical protein